MRKQLFPAGSMCIATLFQSLKESNTTHMSHSTPTGLAHQEQPDERLIYRYSCSHTQHTLQITKHFPTLHNKIRIHNVQEKTPKS